jgi:hypothetical protein
MCYTESIETTYQQGCSGSYFDTVETHTVTLKHTDGSPYNAPSDITFTYTYDYLDVQDVGGSGPTTNTYELIITAGTNQGVVVFYPIRFVNCNYSSACDGSCYSTETNITLTDSDGLNQCIDCSFGASFTEVNEVLPVSGLTWTTYTNTTGYTQCSDAGWTISNLNQTIRYDVSDSSNCGGTCNVIQTGWAEATITIGPKDTNMSLDFVGIAELHDTDYEKIVFKLDGNQIARATSQDLNRQCDMGPVIKIFTVSSPYLLLAGTTHTLRIDFTTADALYHVNSYYQVNLGFKTV